MKAIEVSELHKTFGRSRGARAALDGVSFSIAKGEMVALIGASGSGKSTLIRHIAGLVAADKRSGQCRVSVLGRPVQEGGRVASDVRRSRAENRGGNDHDHRHRQFVGRLLPVYPEALYVEADEALGCGTGSLVRTCSRTGAVNK
jgi:energy-coupling factor transporter ATP-binding protein EcfA2